MSFNVYMVRHGQTYLNQYHRIQGWADAPLTEKGQNDGKHAGKLLAHVKFDAAYSSDLQRTKTTGHLILSENPSELTETIPSIDFREEFFGFWEGYDDMLMWHQIGSPKGGDTYNELVQKFGLKETTNLIADADQYHDAENYDQVWTRIQAGMQLLRDNAHDGDNVLVVTHGTYIRHIMDHYSDKFGAFPGPRNGSVTKLIVDDDHAEVVYTDRLDNIE